MQDAMCQGQDLSSSLDLPSPCASCPNVRMSCLNAKLVMPECLSNIVNMTHSCDISVYLSVYLQALVIACQPLELMYVCIWICRHLVLMGLIIESPVNGKISQLIMHACCSVGCFYYSTQPTLWPLNWRLSATERAETKVNSIIKAGYKL